MRAKRPAAPQATEKQAQETQADETQRGVVFPMDDSGRRSTTTLGRGVVADALRVADPAGAQAVEQQSDWRTGYLPHFRRLVTAGLDSPAAALAIGRAGVDSMHGRMRVTTGDGTDAPLDKLFSDTAAHQYDTTVVTGEAAPSREFSLPYRGDRLTGDALRRQLDAWVAAGVIEPGCAQAVETVAANPDWLELPGRTVLVLGAAAEMGPLTSLMRWGVTAAAVDLPRPALWNRLLDVARHGGGTLLAPSLIPGGTGGAAGAKSPVGADLIRDLPAVADWITGLDGQLVLGNYVYADGATNVRLSVAVDALTAELQGRRPDSALAFLATPTDVFAVPPAAVAHARRAYADARPPARLARRTLRSMSGGRLLHPSYSGDEEVGICDALVPQQGPNYALAKRLQRWRATVARDEGATVSFKVAPPTRTRSVVKNKALAAAYAGAHRFGVEIFEPATSNTLMAALLVHDLHTGSPPHPEPWQDEAEAAAHGGLWRTAYAPRSALGLAALLGLGAGRR